MFHFRPDVSAQRVRGTATAELRGELFDRPINIGVGVRGPVRLPALDISSTIISSFDLMLRRPVWASTAFPHGQLQPYLTAGPALLYTEVDPDVELGVKVGAGLAWQFHQHFALFGEYRFTHFSPDVDTGGLDVGGVETGDLDVEADLNTHYFLAGISFRF